MTNVRSGAKQKLIRKRTETGTAAAINQVTRVVILDVPTCFDFYFLRSEEMG